MAPLVGLELLEDRHCGLRALQFGTVWLPSGRGPTREVEATVRGLCVYLTTTLLYTVGVCIYKELAKEMWGQV